MACLFYVHDGAVGRHVKNRIDADCRFELWRPSLRSFIPPACSFLPFGIWWLFHSLHVFSNRDYCVLLVFHGQTLVHRSCVFPAYFRFPFLAKNDLQIGDTYTHPEYRGRGIATAGLVESVHRLHAPNRVVWYLTNHDNVGSIRVAEKAGFKLMAYGTRRTRLGMRILGQFRIDRVLPDTSTQPSVLSTGPPRTSD